MVHSACCLKSEIFTVAEHDHGPDKDRAVVFKATIRAAMDDIMSKSNRLGAKAMRAELFERFGDQHPDIPDQNQVSCCY